MGEQISPAVVTAVKQFTGWSERLLHARNWVNGSELYHYTSLAALGGILKSEELWLTRMEAQKDPTELSYGLDLFQQIVRDNSIEAAPSPLHKEFFAGLAALDTAYVQKHYQCHVACFAPHGEDVDLWEQYGDGGRGVAIGIRPTFFALREPVEGEPNTVVLPVSYGPLAPLHQIRKVLQVASMALGEVAQYIASNEDMRFALETIGGHLLAGHVLPVCMAAKSDQYRPEMEVRMVAPLPLLGEPTERPHHVAASFPAVELASSILVGERCDLVQVEQLASSACLSHTTVRRAAYSGGLR